MVSRIRKFLVLFLIVGLAVTVIVLNLEPISVHLTPTTKIEARSGVVFLAAFLVGFLTAGVLWVVFGIKAYFRERSLQSKEKQRQEFYRAFLRARGFLATGEWVKARSEWEKLVKKDPTDIVARIELSRSLEGAGEIREALKTLEVARSSEPHNVELLFRAAELNLALSNKTAAIDNLALILYHHPNRKAAKIARMLSEELDRIEDAIEYHSQLDSLGGEEEDFESEKETYTRLRFKKLVKDIEDPQALRNELRKFLKKHPNFVPALRKLANLESQTGNIDEAAQLLVQAARHTGSRSCWYAATKLWIDHNLSDRALSAARTATRNTTGLGRLRAELDMIRLHLALGQSEEGKKLIDNFYSLAKAENVEVDQELSQTHLILKGFCLNRLGEFHDAAKIWEKLSDYDFQISEPELKKQVAANGSAPSPTLSTP